LGIGDWGLGPIPNPQSPIPNPQSPKVPGSIILKIKIFFLKNSLKIIIIFSETNYKSFMNFV